MMTIDAQATWDVSEIIYIDRARQSGANLLNVLRGGNDSWRAQMCERQPQ